VCVILPPFPPIPKIGEQKSKELKKNEVSAGVPGRNLAFMEAEWMERI
jgi:hypothetical protein